VKAVDLALLLPLAGLALVDSTSIGTLFIPVWLMLVPGRVRVGRLLVYLATIAVFYFGVGLVAVVAGESIVSALDGAADNRALLWAQLALGAALFAVSFRFDAKKRAGKPGGGVIGRWRERTMGGAASARWLVGLALLAALAEVATMLPYIGAIGLMATSDVSAAMVPVLLAAYCVVMILPALVLLAGRTLAQRHVEPLLQRLNKWITEKGGNATGWILGAAGVLIGLDAAGRLF
jgi:hypothetical protein